MLIELSVDIISIQSKLDNLARSLDALRKAVSHISKRLDEIADDGATPWIETKLESVPGENAN